MESAEYQLSPRIRLLCGDPVKVRGWIGLFRFVRVWSDDQGEMYADVIGPVPRTELLRTVPVRALRSAGRATRKAVEMNAALRELSQRAKHRR